MSQRRTGDFPPEVLGLIFERMINYDDSNGGRASPLLSSARVNRTWHNIAQPYIFKRCSLGPDNIEMFRLSLPKHGAYVREVRIDCHHDLEIESLEDIVKYCHNVEYLKICQPWDIQQVLQLMIGIKTLKKLEIST